MIIKYPKGYRNSRGLIQIAVSFSETEFQNIIKQGQKDKKNFNDMLRELCRIGLFDLQESDCLEPELEEA